jgi:capsule polysaccharide modification protein KpsS
VLYSIVGDNLVGPHVLPYRLTGSHYRDFLLHDLAKLLEDVPLAVRARVCYVHDVAPAHLTVLCEMLTVTSVMTTDE